MQAQQGGACIASWTEKDLCLKSGELLWDRVDAIELSEQKVCLGGTEL